MFCCSQLRHASVLLRHLDHTDDRFSGCPSRSRPRHRVCIAGWPAPPLRVCSSGAGTCSTAGRVGLGPSAGWESGSQGDKRALIWDEPKEGDVPLARSGGLATIGNHVVLRHAPVSQRPRPPCFSALAQRAPRPRSRVCPPPALPRARCARREGAAGGGDRARLQ